MKARFEQSVAIVKRVERVRGNGIACSHLEWIPRDLEVG